MTLRLGKLTFHLGADYACVMGERQTTDTAIARLYGESRDVEAYGKLFAAAPDNEEMVNLLLRLLEWEDHMGGWEANVWQDAKAWRERYLDQRDEVAS